MTNPTDPAFLDKPVLIYRMAKPDKDCDWKEGLTKREYFAGMALQGVLACPNTASESFLPIVRDAIKLADALIEELSK